MKLYSFFRSGTSHRLRIALHLKGLRPDYFPVDLRVDEQAQAPFKPVSYTHLTLPTKRIV